MTVKNLGGLVKGAASGWVDDYAQSMGAALAYFTTFSIAPLSLTASMRANRASTALECGAHNIVPLRVAHRGRRAP